MTIERKGNKKMGKSKQFYEQKEDSLQQIQTLHSRPRHIQSLYVLCTRTAYKRFALQVA